MTPDPVREETGGEPPDRVFVFTDGDILGWQILDVPDPAGRVAVDTETTYFEYVRAPSASSSKDEEGGLGDDERKLLNALKMQDAERVEIQGDYLDAMRDPSWTGWTHAIEMLIPGSPPRLEELKESLRRKGMGHLADRMDHFARGGDSR